MEIHEYIVFKQFESLISDTRNIMKPKKTQDNEYNFMF